jgi:anti-sigma regulatory factor (Ser/Thr protein kinase)
VSVDGRSVAGRRDRVADRPSRARSAVPLLGQICVPNQAASVALVGRFVGLVVEAHGVAQVGETAALLVSELATNATTHAGAEEWVDVVVTRRRDRLRVEARDGCPALPVSRCPDALDEGGRGLLLVAQLADGHGTYRLPRGKAVWFELIAWDQVAGGRSARGK